MRRIPTRTFQMWAISAGRHQVTASLTRDEYSGIHANAVTAVYSPAAAPTMRCWAMTSMRLFHVGQLVDRYRLLPPRRNARTSGPTATSAAAIIARPTTAVSEQ